MSNCSTDRGGTTARISANGRSLPPYQRTHFVNADVQPPAAGIRERGRGLSQLCWLNAQPFKVGKVSLLQDEDSVALVIGYRVLTHVHRCCNPWRNRLVG